MKMKIKTEDIIPTTKRSVTIRREGYKTFRNHTKYT